MEARLDWSALSVVAGAGGQDNLGRSTSVCASRVGACRGTAWRSRSEASPLAEKAATRTCILRAAGSLFVERGYEQTTVVHVAERAGVSRDRSSTAAILALIPHR